MPRLRDSFVHALFCLLHHKRHRALLLLDGASEARESPTISAHSAGSSLTRGPARCDAQIWPGHKLVCGENAHPFQLPPFSEAEASLNTFEVPGVRAVDLIGQRGALREDDPAATASQRMVGACRVSRRISTPTELVYSLEPVNLVATFTYHYSTAVKSALAAYPTSTWHSVLCHRLMAYGVVLIRHMQQLDAPGSAIRALEQGDRTTAIALAREEMRRAVQTKPLAVDLWRHVAATREAFVRHLSLALGPQEESLAVAFKARFRPSD